METLSTQTKPQKLMPQNLARLEEIELELKEVILQEWNNGSFEQFKKLNHVWEGVLTILEEQKSL